MVIMQSQNTKELRLKLAKLLPISATPPVP